MTVIQIRRNPLAPACFGVVCSQHKDCARYHAVDGSRADPKTIGTCRTRDGYPLFERIELVEAVAA